MIEAYLIHLLIFIGIYSILTVSLNLSIGYTGLINLGHVAFFGIGAYMSALLTLSGMPFVVAFISAGTTSAVFGFLLILTTNKLKGGYFAFATLSFSFVVYSALLNWTSLTKGPLGIAGIPKPNIGGFEFASNALYLLLVGGVVMIVLLLLWRLTSSPYGRLLEAVRDDEVALSMLGKNVFKLKAQSMMIATGLAGLAGSLFAHYITYIDPFSFTLSEIALILTVVMVGGLTSLRGSVVATVIILLIPEMLRFVAIPSSVVGPMRQIIYAMLLIAILIWWPQGLFGRVKLR